LVQTREAVAEQYQPTVRLTRKTLQGGLDVGGRANRYGKRPYTEGVAQQPRSPT